MLRSIVVIIIAYKKHILPICYNLLYYFDFKTNDLFL